MFQRIRKHLNPSTAIAFLALVFAITGGAFAATGGTGNGGGSKNVRLAGSQTLTASAAKSKAKPKTKAGPRGPAGPAGKNGTNGTNGAPGATGPAGPGGPAGPTGATGATGTNGESVTSSATPGAKCPEGGSKFTVGGKETFACNGEKGVIHPEETLPSGASETGAWAFQGEILASGQIGARVPISFNIPLQNEIVGSKAHFVTKAEWESRTPVPPAECEGTPEKPEAEPGSLCVYEGAPSQNLASGAIYNPAGPHIQAVPGAARTGAFIVLSLKGAAEEDGSGAGTWAVTAP
jgi:hypothetical protein